MRIAKHYIDGIWTNSLDGKLAYRLCHNPATSEAFSRYACGGQAEIAAAINAASRAFFDTGWAGASAMRGEILMDFSARLSDRRYQIADCLVSLNGCLRREALAEIKIAASYLQHYAALARGIYGRTIETASGGRSVLTCQPAGVVAMILPWNSPIASLINVLGLALASGCAVVMSPATQTALAHNLALECLTCDDRLPAGIVNSVIESEASFAEAFCRAPEVDLVSFTGGSRRGKRLASIAAGTFKRLSLNLTRKALAIVFEDQAKEATVSAVVAASLVGAGQSGQLRTAIGHVLIEEGAYRDFVSRVGDAFRSLRVGHGYDTDSQMGCMISIDRRDQLAAHVEGLRTSAQVLVQGQIPRGRLAAGAFIGPSLVEVANDGPPAPGMLSGPILYVESFRGEDQVVVRANTLRNAGTVSVWSADLRRNDRLCRLLRFTTVKTNNFSHFIEAGARYAGGVDFFGATAGMDGLQTFLEGRTLYMELEA